MSEIRSDKRQLNICPLEIYDGTLGRLQGIGIKSSYSDALLKNIEASAVADHFGLKSVDYVRKTYLNDWKRHVDLDPNAFDLKTIHFLDSCICELRKHLIANSHNLIYSEIQTISDMTLAKGLGTLGVALDLSSKGLLHEVLALCRSSMEMMMWASAIFDLPDDKDPFEFLPEKAIPGFKTDFPDAGRYYGYLSEFSHWRKETHKRAFKFDKEYIAVVYASGGNKWEAIANVILMTHLFADVYAKKYTSLKCKAHRKNYLPEICAIDEGICKRRHEWLHFLTELEGQAPTQSFVDIFGIRYKA